MTRGFLCGWLAIFAAGCQQHPAAIDTPATDESVTIVEATRNHLLACRIAEFGDTRLRHPYPVVSIALTDDGKHLATATANEPVVRLWDVASSELIEEFRLAAKVPSSFRIVGFSPDGSKLLTFCLCPSPFDHLLAGVPVTIDCRTGAMKNWPWAHFMYSEPYGTSLKILSNTEVAYRRHDRIEVYDFDSGATKRTIKVSKDEWTVSLTAGFDVSPDGTQLVSGNAKSGISILSLEKQAPPKDLPARIYDHGQSDFLSSRLKWLSDGMLLECHDGVISMIDPENGKVIAKSDRQPDEFRYPVAIGDRAVYIRTQQHHTIRKYDLNSMKRLPVEFPYVEQHIRDRIQPVLAVSKDDTVLASATGNTVRLFDARTGQPLHRHIERSPMTDVVQIRFSRDGAKFMATDGRTAQFWDVASKKIVSAYANDKNYSPSFGNWQANVTGPFFSPNGKLLATARESDGRIVVREIDGNREIAKEPEWGDIRGSRFQLLDFLDDNTLLAKDGPTGPFVSIRYRNWDVIRTSESSPQAQFLVTSGLAGRMACSSTELTVVDLTNPAKVVTVDSHRSRMGQPRCGLSPPPFAMPVRFSNDGRFLTTWDHGFVLWDLKNDAAQKVGQLTTQHFGEWYSREASFSPDGKRMIGLLTNVKEHANKHFHEIIHTALVWDTETGKELFRFQPPGGATVCEFHPDGKQLLIAHPNSTFSLWDYAALEKQFVK